MTLPGAGFLQEGLVLEYRFPLQEGLIPGLGFLQKGLVSGVGFLREGLVPGRFPTERLVPGAGFL
jgi:hypothetical protein